MLQLGINAVLRGRENLAIRDKRVSWAFTKATEGDRSRLSVISTNYDTSVEQKLFDAWSECALPSVRMWISACRGGTVTAISCTCDRAMRDYRYSSFTDL